MFIYFFLKKNYFIHFKAEEIEEKERKKKEEEKMIF